MVELDIFRIGKCPSWAILEFAKLWHYNLFLCNEYGSERADMALCRLPKLRLNPRSKMLFREEVNCVHKVKFHPIKPQVRLAGGQAKQGWRQPRRRCLWLLTCRGGGWCEVGRSVGTSPGPVEAPPRLPGLPTHPPPRPPRSRPVASLPAGVCAPPYQILLSFPHSIFTFP